MDERSSPSHAGERVRLVGPRRKTAMVLAVVLILLLWQVAAWSLPDFLMPDVHTVFLRLWAEIGSVDFRSAPGASLGRLGSGSVAAPPCRVVFGLVVPGLYVFRGVF